MHFLPYINLHFFSRWYHFQRNTTFGYIEVCTCDLGPLVVHAIPSLRFTPCFILVGYFLYYICGALVASFHLTKEAFHSHGHIFPLQVLLAANKIIDLFCSSIILPCLCTFLHIFYF